MWINNLVIRMDRLCIFFEVVVFKLFFMREIELKKYF